MKQIHRPPIKHYAKLVKRKVFHLLFKIERGSGRMSAYEQKWLRRSDYGGLQANNQLPTISVFLGQATDKAVPDAKQCIFYGVET